MLILMKWINVINLFHRICLQKILISPKLVHVFVRRNLQFFLHIWNTIQVVLSIFCQTGSYRAVAYLLRCHMALKCVEGIVCFSFSNKCKFIFPRRFWQHVIVIVPFIIMLKAIVSKVRILELNTQGIISSFRGSHWCLSNVFWHISDSSYMLSNNYYNTLYIFKTNNCQIIHLQILFITMIVHDR